MIGTHDPEEVTGLSASALMAGYTADISFGDPPRHHPVAWFGHAAQLLERVIYAPTRQRGVIATALAVSSVAATAEYAARRLGRQRVLAALTWVALGGRSLRDEAARVERLLTNGELDAARQALCALCGRDATDLDPAGIRRGVIESLAENTADAVVAPLCFAALTGPAGVAAYRAANTLDAMWGHHNVRYEDFGWAAARLDDLFNLVPARLTAGLAAAVADVGHERVETAFAGALGVALGGPVSYRGSAEPRPYFAAGREPEAKDVARAAGLSRAVGALALLTCMAVAR